MLEIERKWRVKLKPGIDLDKLAQKVEAIEQGYLLTGKTEVRVRAKGGKFYLALKKALESSQSHLDIREETEVEITEPVFQILWQATAGCRLTKTRHSIFNQGLIWELDQYHATLEGLWLLEVELPTADTPISLPEWVQKEKEVTNDLLYRNATLAELQGRTADCHDSSLFSI